MLNFIKQLFEQQKYKVLKPEEFSILLKMTNKPVILDVRTKPEFDREKIPNAMNLDVMNPSFANKIQHLNKKKAYFVYCQGSFRSKRACRKLSAANFEEVYLLKGGINKWTGRRV